MTSKPPGIRAAFSLTTLDLPVDRLNLSDMRLVKLVLLSAIMLITTSQTIGKPSLNQFLARRNYEKAVAFYKQQVAFDSTDALAVRNLARIYDYWHKYDMSLCWWNRALILNPNDDSARRGRWNSRYRRDENDSVRLTTTKQLITREAQKILAETTAATLALAFDGLSLGDTTQARQTAVTLTRYFPNSPKAYEIIGTMFYDSLYPIWRNDTLKVPLLRRFLKRFPDTEWRTTIYTYLLSSLYQLNDTAGVKRTAKEMVTDDPSDPFRWRYAAAILNRMKAIPETAAKYARKAIELEPRFTKPPNKPSKQWKLEYPVLYASSRLALAQALKDMGNLKAAHHWLVEAIKGSDFGIDCEATFGSLYEFLGEIDEELGDTLAAQQSYIEALVQGDTRNLSSARADSSLRRLWQTDEHELLKKARKATDYSGPQFTDVTGEAGLTDLHGARVAWGDYNNDGFDDLLVSGHRLFRNDSGKRFVEVTDAVGLSGARGRGSIWADFDNDGWLDFYMCGHDTTDKLWRNTQGRFMDVTVQAGNPSDPYPTEGCAWADFDNDGFVDLYCANYENWAEHSHYPDRLYRNQSGIFHNITNQAGIIPPFGLDRAGRGVAWADFDNDGYQDCFVANYRLQENFLWHNNRNSTFTNIAPMLGIAGDEKNGWFGHTIGAAWGDYDNDGDLDLFTADLAHPRYIEFSNRSRLYENLGQDTYPGFCDRRAASGIKYEETHSNPAWADVDNDGDLDLYITSIYKGRRSFLYENLGKHHSDSTVRFRDITWLSGTRCFNGWGCAFADYDCDGDMDLVVGSGSGMKLFRNDTRNSNHWLELKVKGTKANCCGIGSRITVFQNRNQWIREVEAGSGTTSQNSLIQHLGLGKSDAPLIIKVRFGPKSTVQLNGVKTDRIITVIEP